jgi:flagellar biosynthetic protein FlhB
LVEFAKSLVKIVLVGAAALVLLWPAAPRVLAALGLEAGPLLGLLHTLALRLLVGVAALTALCAVLDSLYQRFERHRQLRMSRRDLQDEFKQTEGDPLLKARLRSLRLERARRRMMAELPKATVVVTNPSHVAVALRYDATMAAPRLIAKCAG